ncbi:hypothetical protein F4861DRAFT_446898 [Xylaria intraflava]|nr:hypothetical protein F4861DRAFT_446898 [Xylaria intraflava]
MTIHTILSAALPAELLSYVLNHHVHPTTLIICSPKSEFIASVVEDIQRQPHAKSDQGEPQEGERSHHQDPEVTGTEVTQALLSSPLYQVAISRHVRVVYAPTVTHLRAHLSVFSPNESCVPAPPPTFTAVEREKPHIILYGFLRLHRDTSEWSAQGLSNTASTLVELAHRLSWKAVLIEPRDSPRNTPLREALRETVPILSGGARRLGLHSEDGAWTGRTVEIGRVLGRWFHFQKAQWDSHD